MSSPSTNGGNGRDANGRFAKGNPGGPGNPLVKRACELRVVLLREVQDGDLKAVYRTMLKAAKKGEPWAVREFLDRVLGRAPQALELSSPDGSMGAQAMVSAILEALADMPEARAKVARRLMEKASE